jgi:hypothetical protein
LAEGEVNDIASHLDQRLHSIAEEGLKAAKIAVAKVMSANATQLANSRIWFLYDEAIEREFVNALNRAAVAVAEIGGSSVTERVTEWGSAKRREEYGPADVASGSMLLKKPPMGATQLQVGAFEGFCPRFSLHRRRGWRRWACRDLA